MVYLDRIFETWYFIFFFFLQTPLLIPGSFLSSLPSSWPIIWKADGAVWCSLTNERIAWHMLCYWVSKLKHPSTVPEQRQPVSHRRSCFQAFFLSSCLHSASLPSFVFSPARRCPLLSPTTKISQHAKDKHKHTSASTDVSHGAVWQAAWQKSPSWESLIQLFVPCWVCLVLSEQNGTM